MNKTSRNGRFQLQIGLVFTLVGLFVFLLGADPGLFGLDRSPVFGFLQISVFLIGLAVICLGGYISLSTLWLNKDKTIAADLGLRLVSTGYVIAVISGMADVFGLGSQSLPDVPYFGPIQAIGVIVGVVVIGLGFLLLIPFGRDGEETEEKSASEG